MFKAVREAAREMLWGSPYSLLGGSAAGELEILPDRVRYQLRYNQGILEVDDLEALIARGFIDAAIYLIVRSLNACPSAQQYVIGCLCEALLKNPRIRDVARTLIGVTRDDALRKIQRALAEAPHLSREYSICTTAREMRLVIKEARSSDRPLPSAIFPERIIATKLAQLSRQGFTAWLAWYGDLAHQYAGLEQTPVFISYSTFLRFRCFLAAYQNLGVPMYFLIPKWINDPASLQVGYKLTALRGRYQLEILPRAFKRPKSHVVLIEDTVRSGAKLRAMLEFWDQGNRAEAPLLEIRCNPYHTLIAPQSSVA